MPWSVTSNPNKFEEAIAWFRERVAITPSAWRTLGEAASRRAFTVAGLAQLDLINDVMRSLESAVTEGLALETWQEQIAARVTKAWGDTVANPASRLETIYRTNTQSAYAAGRHKQMTDPDVAKARPFWMYDAVMDSRTSAICSNLNGTILPSDDPWWNTRYPPNHFGCRSGVRTLTRSGAERRGGITSTPNTTEAQDGFRALPDASEWEPDMSKYPKILRDAYERKQRSEP